MPHLRSPSVSSFQSLFRKGSLLGGSKSSVSSHTAADVQNENGMISVLSLSACNQHLHMLPPIPATIQPDQSIIDWVNRIHETRPEIVLATSPKYFSVNESTFNEIDSDSVQLNPSASLLFMRILNTKLYNWNEKTTYQLQIKVGDNIVGTSCNSNKSSGDLIDWFLIDLNQVVDVYNCWIEISVHQHVQERKHKSIRNILGLTSSSDKHKASQSSSNYDLSAASTPASITSNIRIPLFSVAFSNDDRFPKPWGTYYLCDVNGNNKILGEITFDISESPESFIIAPFMAKSKSESRFTGPLTVLRNEGRVAHWQRITGSISNRELFAQDFQRGNNNSQATLWSRSLKQVSAIDFIKKHPMSIDNVIELTFANGEKLYSYADSEEMGLKWANKLSLAIWGQPYTLEEQY